MWKKSPALVLLVLLAIHVLAHIDRNMLLGFSTRIVADLGLSNAQYGFLVGAVWVLSFGVMAIVMGSLADRFSRSRVIAGGLLVWSACTAASGLAHGFWELVAARMLVATGEAALVPASIALLTELFEPRRRGTAIGIFFMGIPLGIGGSFLLAGTLGAAQGWRHTFIVLGMIGSVVALLLSLLREDRVTGWTHPRGQPFPRQVADVFGTLRGNPTLRWTIGGFVLVHFALVGLSFAQLWLVRERGLDAASITRSLGAVQLGFGLLGAVAGGALGDRVGRQRLDGYARFAIAAGLLCGPLMLAYRFAAPGSPLFYAGMAAGAFLPMAIYGPANALIQSQVGAQMRSTVAGVTMMLINVFAIALGNLGVGALSDRLAHAGVANGLTLVLLGTDVLALGSVACFAVVARRCAGVATAHALVECPGALH